MTRRFDFFPRCASRLFCVWPCRTASVVPMIAGHAAIDVIIPRTILKEELSSNSYKERRSRARRYGVLLLDGRFPNLFEYALLAIQPYTRDTVWLAQTFFTVLTSIGSFQFGYETTKCHYVDGFNPAWISEPRGTCMHPNSMK